MKILQMIGCSVAAMAMNSGCLLLAEPPPFVDRCLDEDLGEEVGQALARGNVSRSQKTYDCPDKAVYADDMVFAWTAPEQGIYQIRVQGDIYRSRIGVGAPECRGELDVCVQDGDTSDADDASGSVAILRIFEAGELVHIAVGQEWEDEGDFTLSITPYNGPSTSSGGNSGSGGQCTYRNDGECDEPRGTGLCLDGTDPADCVCLYRNDGECDEPSLCPYGSDDSDCS